MTKMKNQLFFSFVSVLFFATSTQTSIVDLSPTNQSEENCRWLNHVCGFCENIEWDVVGLNSTVCIEIAYLPDDYGFSLIVTWDNSTELNETISGRNPPAVCFGIPELEKMHVAVCLQLYDLEFGKKRFHGCAKMSMRCLYFFHKSVNLGCFGSPEKTFTEAVANISHLVLKTIKEQRKNLITWKNASPTVNMI